MSPDPRTAREDANSLRRERQARLLGGAAAVLMVVLLVATIRWPGPFVAAAVGYGVYRLAGGRAF